MTQNNIFCSDLLPIRSKLIDLLKEKIIMHTYIIMNVAYVLSLKEETIQDWFSYFQIAHKC